MVFLPFSSGFEHDYDYEAAEIAKDTAVTEDDVLALNELRYGSKLAKTRATGFLDQKFDTYSRGTDSEDFKIHSVFQSSNFNLWLGTISLQSCQLKVGRKFAERHSKKE